MIFKSQIELCESQEEELAGRVKVKITALKLADNDNDNNENGINWVKKYVQDNLKSFIGASYKVCFIDDEKMIPYGHGTMEHDDNGNVIFEDSDTVGSIQEAKIKTINIDGKDTDVVVTYGYLYIQSYPNFVEWLRDEKNKGEIYCSVEINGKGKSKKIIYANKSKNEDGTPRIGRKPKVFDFVSIAILSDLVPPADKFSRVIEVNSKEGEQLKKIKSAQTVELNELSYDDIAILITRAFNKIMINSNHYDYCYYLYKLYPESNRVVLQDYSCTPYEYYMTTYTIQNNKITLGDILKVEQDWKPVNDEKEVEINTSIIKNRLLNQENTKEENSMDEKAILEINQKIEDKTNEINSLNTKNIELENKNKELNETVVNANKTLEEVNAKNTSMAEELNSTKAELEKLKQEKESTEKDAKKAEINSYFKNEIPKNKFLDAEVNSLKHFIDEIDLDGLKTAESELCTKKFKEMRSKEDNDAEINSKANMSFISIHEPDKKHISDKQVTFFN